MKNAIDASGAEDMLFIAAAGNGYGNNNDQSPYYPATYDSANVIAVAATDHNDNLANFSNYGPTTVDLAAPGDDVYSTTPGNGYGTKSGTSMATPHVAGAAALLCSTDSGLSNLDVKATLMSTVDPLSALAVKVLSGGRLNLYSALMHDLGDVRLELEPDATTIARPGTLRYKVTATNRTASSKNFDYWTNVNLPNGSLHPPAGALAGPFNVTLSADESRSAYISHTIPGGAPLGTYTYNAYVGTYPSTVEGERQFYFSVMP